MATFGQFREFGPYFEGGNLQAGVLVYHYAAGTTNLLDVYSDRAKSTTAAQPLVADSQGIAWCYGDGLYKFVVKDSSGVTLYTYDNVNLTDGSLSLTGKGANIASASTLILGTDGDEFIVTGAVNIDKLSGTQTTVKLVFSGTPILKYSGNLLLAGGISYQVVANDVFTFVNEGLSGGNYIFREVSRAVYSILPSSHTESIYGFTYMNDVSDATNDLDITAGGCMDSTGLFWLTGTALIKQSDVVWGSGTNAGALDTGAVGDHDYYIWVIGNGATVDYLFSLSSTGPTMPTGYIYKRLIGWFKRASATIVVFHTYETEGGGLEYAWDVPTLDVNLSNTLTTARHTDAVKVPLNLSTIAHLNVSITDAASLALVWVCCPDQGDAAPSGTAAPLSNLSLQATGVNASTSMRIRTSVTGTIAARANLATVDLYNVVTLGFTWSRRT